MTTNSTTNLEMELELDAGLLAGARMEKRENIEFAAILILKDFQNTGDFLKKEQ